MNGDGDKANWPMRGRNIFETPKSPSKSTRNVDPPRPGEGASMLSTSPRRRNPKSIFSDRYIPNRTGVDLQAAFSWSSKDLLPDVRNRPEGVDNEVEIQKEEKANQTFSTILKAELFGDNVPMATANLTKNGKSATGAVPKPPRSGSRPSSTGNVNLTSGSGSLLSSRSSLLLDSGSAGADDIVIGNSRITPPRSTRNTPSGSNLGSGSVNASNHDTVMAAAGVGASGVMSGGSTNTITNTPRQSANLFTYQSPKKSRPVSRDLHNEVFSLSPVRQESQKLLLSPQKKPRSISKVPYRVLDAPELSDDFYLNLVDWGAQDVLAVGLGDSVYLWDGATQSVDRLCNLSNKDKVTSISWIGTGTHLAVGTLKGLVEIWDATKMKCVRTMTGHSLRVSSLAWNEHILSSGSRDRSILNRDVRIEDHYVNRFDAHKQEVCGLKWNVDENKLASGGNDNRLLVWDGLNPQPLYEFTEHTAAIKAILWSPHQRGILSSGGGTADKTIKIWNTLTGSLNYSVNTGSQVCNLIWSKNSNELVSTHGFSRNQMIVWKYPSMQQIAQLTGHTYRVLYLSLSPDGETIVTGAGDETLRFWNVFEKNKNDDPPSSVLLDAFLQLR